MKSLLMLPFCPYDLSAEIPQWDLRVVTMLQCGPMSVILLQQPSHIKADRTHWLRFEPSKGMT
jgi:hypothetical protein